MAAKDFIQKNDFLQSSIGTVEWSRFELLDLETVFIQSLGFCQPIQGNQITRYWKSGLGAALQNCILFRYSMAQFLYKFINFFFQ